jgi:hypothetical protein
MKIRHAALPLIMALALGACTKVGGSTGSPVITNLPEAVVAMVAPNQDLSTVRVKPEDGCYWYQHQGVVETTLLPLRNVEGRPICTKPQV